MLDFVAWHTFVDDGDILLLVGGLTSLIAVATVAVTACLGRRLYGPAWGLAAAGLLALSAAARALHVSSPPSGAPERPHGPASRSWTDCRMPLPHPSAATH